MEHKPVHIITNLPKSNFLERCVTNNLDVEAIAEDYTQEEGYHVHAYIAWPVGRIPTGQAVLKPRRPNFVRGCRRKFGCVACHNSQSNARCVECQLWFKFIWAKSDEHVENIKRYIHRKVDAVLWRQQQHQEG